MLSFLTDVNECNLLNGNCSQLCNNTDDSYSCDCEDGFTLNIQDYSTCHGMHTATATVWSTD